MRKYFFTFILFTATLSLSAQHKPYQFGFKLSGNIGWYNSYEDNYQSNGIKAGFSWGFVSDIFLMENYSIITGVEMLFLNGTLNYPYATFENNDSINGTMSNKFNNKYLEIPVVFTMKTNEIKGLRYFGQIGAGLGILLNAKEEGTFNGETLKSINSDMFRLFRGSFIIGAGVEYPIDGSTYLRVGLQYNNNFNNILKGNNTLYTSIKNEGRVDYLELNVNILF